jgi:hypothetical protein
MTFGLRCTSRGRPWAISSPKSSTAIRSLMSMTSPMSCSISSTVRPLSRILRISFCNPCFSAGFIPAAGSSSSSSRGSVARALAISRRRWSP